MINALSLSSSHWLFLQFLSGSLLTRPPPKPTPLGLGPAPSSPAAYLLGCSSGPASLLPSRVRRLRSHRPVLRRRSAASFSQEITGMDDSADFEFFKIILEDGSMKLRLPDKFAELLHGHEPREVKLREAGGGRRLWDVEVVFDGSGHMYLGRGWDQFAREHDVQRGHFLVFSYDGHAVLTVKVFDGSMCRRHYHYQHDDDASSGSSSDGDSGSNNSSDGDSGSNNSSDGDSGSNNDGDSGRNSNSSRADMEMEINDAPTSQFTIMLRECNLRAKQMQYLNVPVEFQIAHGYAERSKVELRMRGKSWTVTVKHSPREGGNGNARTSLRYGWHQFCVDNGLDVGDTCFFRALRGGDAGRGEDHALKVEVRKRDGAFLD